MAILRAFRSFVLAFALLFAVLSGAGAYTFSYSVWPAWMIDVTNAVAAYNGAYFQFGTATGVPAHVGSAQTTAPALTSCGTSPSIVGTDFAGTVTMGTGTPTGC